MPGRTPDTGREVGQTIVSISVLGRREDGRAYVWREYGTIAHLTALNPYVPKAVFTACNRPIPIGWRWRNEGVLRPLCPRCAKVDEHNGA
jgi:hypothetical protein